MRYKIFRQILGKTQKEIARIIGFSQQFWADLEKGTKKMKNTTLNVLMQKFGVNPDWLEGKTHILFCDWQKGLEIVKCKSTLTRWELLFLLEVMSWVWSQPLKIEKTTAEEEAFIANLKNVIKETRKDFIINLCYAVKYVLKKIQNLQFRTSWLENLLQVYGNLISKIDTIQNEPPSLYIARELAKTLHSFLCEVELDSLDEFKLSSFLLPWGYYVALSYLPLKQDLVPLSSIYFIWDIPFNEKEKNEKTIQSLLSSLQNPIQKENVYIEFREYAGEAKVDILIIGKGKITLDLDEIFGFFTAVMESEKRINFSVLKYSIQERNVTEKDIVIDKRYTIALTQNEYYCLIEIVREISENTDFWMYLQRIYLQKYGFV